MKALKRAEKILKRFGNPQGVWNYELEAINPSDYELKISCVSQGKLFTQIFNQTRKAKKLKEDQTPDKINNFLIIEPRFTNLLSVITRGWVNQVKEKYSDQITLLTSSVSRAMFVKDQKTKDWNVEIIIKGQYIEK